MKAHGLLFLGVAAFLTTFVALAVSSLFLRGRHGGGSCRRLRLVVAVGKGSCGTECACDGGTYACAEGC